VHLAAGTWTTDKDMHQDFAAALRLPDYYGGNLDALDDWTAQRGTYNRPGQVWAMSTKRE
jgi:RNAse (barnase) inhibitor barstar